MSRHFVSWTAAIVLSVCGAATSGQDPAPQMPIRTQQSSTGASDAIRTLIKEGRYQDAVIAARSLLAQTQTSGGRDSAESLDALDLLVESLWRSGQLSDPETRQLAEQAVTARESGPEGPALATSLLQLAALYSAAEDQARAKPLFERTLDIQERTLGPAHADIGLTLNVFGISRRRAGDYREAKRLIERGLAVREEALGPDHLDLAGSLNDLAIVLVHMGDPGQAVSVLERAVAIWEKNLRPDHPRVALGVSNLAAINASLGDVARARPFFERALAIQEKTLGPVHPSVALTLSNLATCLQALGEFDAARRLFERSLAIRERVFGPDHSDVGHGLIAYADFLSEVGDHDAARRMYERAVATLEKARGSEHPDVAVSRYHLAAELGQTGATGRAIEEAVRADAISTEHVRLTARALPEREALLYAGSKPYALDLALTLALKNNSGTDARLRRSIAGALIRARALVLDEMAARHRVAAWTRDPALSRLVSDLSATRANLARLVVRGPGNLTPERYRSLVDTARQEKDAAERTMAEKSLAFRSEEARSRMGLEDVGQALPPNSALVAFVRYRSHEWKPRGSSEAKPAWVPSYMALVLRQGEGDPAFVGLGPAAEIDALVFRWRDQIGLEAAAPGRASRRLEASYRVTAGDLRRRVWDPIAGRLEGVKQVFLVPDGALNLLSFSALPIGANRYLVENEPAIHYLTAERDLVPSDVTAPSGGLLAVGAPAFDDARSPVGTASGTAFRGIPSDCRTFESMRFASLPQSGMEAERIISLWEKSRRAQVRYLTGPAATEAAFKREAAGTRVLHLATHAFFLGGHCASALDERAQRASMELPAVVTGENPLLLSGLALAGANHRGAASDREEDGILTAEEIAALDLTGVEWAVLSACDTGTGAIRAGEGVFGLRRAFQIAGVRTIIMSLWPIEDKAARVWMTALYEGRFLKHLDTAQAARQANLRVLTERRANKASTHPFYWAGFIQAGDWR